MMQNQHKKNRLLLYINNEQSKVRKQLRKLRKNSTYNSTKKNKFLKRKNTEG